MTFNEFQATGRDVVDLRAYPHFMAARGDDAPTVIPGRMYEGDLYLECMANDSQTYHLVIGNDSRVSADRASLELALFEFAVSEGYIDGPTTEQELIAALQGLCDYVGGSDAPAWHPCRIAHDLLARIG